MSLIGRDFTFDSESGAASHISNFHWLTVPGLGLRMIGPPMPSSVWMAERRVWCCTLIGGLAYLGSCFFKVIILRAFSCSYPGVRWWNDNFAMCLRRGYYTEGMCNVCPGSSCYGEPHASPRCGSFGFGVLGLEFWGFWRRFWGFCIPESLIVPGICRVCLISPILQAKRWMGGKRCHCGCGNSWIWPKSATISELRKNCFVAPSGAQMKMLKMEALACMVFGGRTDFHLRAKGQRLDYC